MPLIKRTLEDEEALMREWTALAGDGPIKEPLNQDDVDAMFDKPSPKSEPSMEEILASIRRIMKEDPEEDRPTGLLAMEYEAMLPTSSNEEPQVCESSPRPCPKCKSTHVLCQCDIDSLLGFDEPAELSMTDLLIKMRTDKKLRKESMPFWSFLSDLAIGMTAIRDSWPKNWKHVGLWMNDENRLILNGEEWQPTQDDLFADDWQIGD